MIKGFKMDYSLRFYKVVGEWILRRRDNKIVDIARR